MKRSSGILDHDHVIPVQPLRSSSLSSSSTASTSHSDCDARDYHGLEHALKRVRISASPGQLRLENDLQSLILHHSWREILNEDSIVSEYYDYKHQIAPIPSCTNFNWIISSTRLQQLQRDATDPLRFTLTVWMPSLTICNHSPCSIKWVYHIQIPRMYPHSPPMIHRMIKSVADEQGRELYRLTSDLTNDSFPEYCNSAQLDFYDLNGNRVSVEVDNRAQSPCVTLWVSHAWDDRHQQQHLEREKAWMLTAIIISSRGLNMDPSKKIMYGMVDESKESDQDKKVSCLLYNKNPYQNMAAFQYWSPILQLSDFIALLLKISREWEEVVVRSDSIPSCSIQLY